MHDVESSTGEKSYCGDHYCSGHTITTWKCKDCDWEYSSSGSSYNSEDTTELSLSHIWFVLQKLEARSQ